MKEFKINQDGVPNLSRNNIEEKAEEVIEFFNSATLLRPCETHLQSLLEGIKEISKNNKFSYDFSQDLGNNAHGHKILGKFCFKPRAILVDVSLNNDLKQKFVVGHELGHLILHRNLLIKKEGYADVDITDIEQDLVTGRKNLVTPRDWLEWQANRFGSALLMPRKTFIAALIEIQQSLNIHRNLGQVYLDEQKENFHNFMQICDKLSEMYKVTNTNAEIRLKQLGLLNDKRGKSTKHISELFMGE